MTTWEFYGFIKIKDEEIMCSRGRVVGMELYTCMLYKAGVLIKASIYIIRNCSHTGNL